MAVVTDNVSANVAAWEMLDTTYEAHNISFYGCAGHIGNLFIKDIARLPALNSIIELALKIVNEIKKSRILLSSFTKIQQENVNDKKKISLK